MAPKPAIPTALRPLAREVSEHRLKNGLRIRLLPNHEVPGCSLHTFFRVGSRNEKPGLTGISHLFEHMMFNGARRYGPGEFDSVMESNGGHANAYTSNDFTVYQDDFMAEALETVLDLESDRMQSLRITKPILERERNVVLEERRLRVDNDVMGQLDEELSSLAYKAHPYRWPVLGWERDIENISQSACQEFFRTYYAPNNATVYLTGDFDPKQALSWMKKYYERIPPGPAPQEVIDAEPSQRGPRTSEIRYPAQAPSLLFGFRGPKARDEDTFALDVIQYALSVGQSSRLTRALVFEQEIAVSVSLDWSWRLDPGLFIVELELQPKANLEDAKRLLFEQFDRVRKDGLTEEELEKAANNLRAQLFRELGTNHGRSHALGHYDHLLGDWRAGFSLPSVYSKVTVAQVKKAANEHLTEARASRVTLIPAEASA